MTFITKADDIQDMISWGRFDRGEPCKEINTAIPHTEEKQTTHKINGFNR
jgi:hypothetical protein